jgi:alcohol oxidase
MSHTLSCHLTRSTIVLTIFTICSGIDAGIKIRPNKEDLQEIGPAFEVRWNTYFANAPDKPVMWIGISAGYVFSPP